MVDGLAITCALEGRVSLANLMEFSHFIDLYVLEDQVYVGDGDFDIYLREFTRYAQSPLRELPSGTLSRSVSSVSD